MRQITFLLALVFANVISYAQFFGDKEDTFERLVFPLVYSEHSPLGINAVMMKNKRSWYAGLHFNSTDKSEDYRIDKKDQVYYDGDPDVLGMYTKVFTQIDSRTLKEEWYEDVIDLHTFTDRKKYTTSGLMGSFGITQPIVNKRLWLTAGTRIGFMQVKQLFTVSSISVVGSSTFDDGSKDLWLARDDSRVFFAPEAGFHVNLGVLTLCTGGVFYPQINQVVPYFGGSIDLQRLFPWMF